MRVLFADHASHRATQSADFFTDILRTAFTVDTFYYDTAYRHTLPKGAVAAADVIVFWEFLNNRRDIGVPGKRCVFVPMHDNEWGSKWQWRRIAASGMPVISFSNATTRHARQCGVTNILDIRFAFNPADFHGMGGNPRIAALWDRGCIRPETVGRLLSPEAIDKLIVFRRQQSNAARCEWERHRFGFEVEVRESGFLSRSQHLEQQKEAGVFIAPRPKEGIGMAFLEQLAMGKAVIAHDGATMNEYLADGAGILRDFTRNLRPVTAVEIDTARKNAANAATAAYARWTADKARIVPFIANAARNARPLQTGSARDTIMYALYLLEGARLRATEKMRDIARMVRS